jgi:hypothetical protein
LTAPDRPPVLVRTEGGFALSLSPDERALLSSLPNQLARALDAVGETDAQLPEGLRRLFPAAYPTDAAAEANYVSLVRDDLVEHHRNALETLAHTALATHLSDDETDAWLAALNDLRIVLGASLGVTEETVEPAREDPQYAEWICYNYLTYLESLVVDALADVLPPSREDDPSLDDPWGEPPGGLRWDGTPVPPDM